MGFNFLEYFYTNSYDEEILLKKDEKNYSVLELKPLIFGEIQYLKTLKEKNITIKTENNFDFIILFISGVLAGKNIIIENSNKKDSFENSKILFEIQGKKEEKYSFEKINTDDIKISIYTSGSTNTPKLIQKNLTQILRESFDTIKILNLENKKYEFNASVPINHMYALTAYFLTPMNSKNIINTNRIDYFETLDNKNSVFVTSPSFLSYVKKYSIEPVEHPKIILSAGANLEDEIQKYFEFHSKVINFYGCTESGFIAYKEKGEEKYFKLLDGIKIISSKDETVITSDYAEKNEIILGDRIKQLENNLIEIEGRLDRIFKVREKRVSALELEEEILKNGFIKKCHLIDLDNKIGAIAELNNDGVNYFLKNGVLNLIKNISENLNKKFHIIPKKWKFIDEIPVNDLGKYDTNKIKGLFSTNLSLPLILKRKIEGNEAEFELYFYRNCNFFKGHFEGFPIVAGVVQLYYASYLACSVFNLKNCRMGQIKRIKYSSIIHPDTVIKLKLIKSEKSVSFEYYDEKTPYSSGVLPVENIFEGAI